MKTRRLIGSLAACLWLLSACGQMTIRDSEAQRFIPIEGWVLQLHQDVVIPPGRTRVFFQRGSVTYAVNEFEPHCQLRVRDISDNPRTVRSDHFRIGKVYGTSDQVVISERIRLAAIGDAVTVGGGNGNGNGESRMIYFYFMALHADSQPNVTFWVCGGAMDDPALAEYPTLQELRVSMGEYADLLISGESSR